MAENYYIDQEGHQFHMSEQDAEEFVGLTRITTPKPDDGKEYQYSLENDGWEEIVQANPTTAELMDRMSDVLGLSQEDLTGVINGLIAQYTPQLPAPTREDIFTSANKPGVPGNYWTMKPLTDFEYLGFLWNTSTDGKRQEEYLIPTRVFLALPSVPVGHWTLNPVSSITRNKGHYSFCACPIPGETHKIRISQVNGYFLESIWGYK